MSFHCHQSSRSPRGTPIEYANERYTRLALTVREENRPPAITAVLPESDTMDTVAEGDLWRFAVTALDPDDGDPLSYTWHYSLDGGVSWNLTPHAEPEITDLVPFEAVRHPAAILGGGQLQMRVTVSDNKGAQDSHTWTAMHVHDRNRRPEARPPGEPAAWGWLTGGSTGQPPAHYWSAAVWTGNRMIAWGGYGSATILNTGGRYDPLTGTWQSTSTQNAPSARFGHGAVWTGTKLLVWGGRNNDGVLGDGGIYDPATDTWTAMNADGAPTPRSMDVPRSAVWTGSRMLIFGGISAASTALGDGGMYDPLADRWTRVQSHPEVLPRYAHCALWTGKSLLVWGGNSGHPDYQVIQAGAEFSPAPAAAIEPAAPVTGDALACTVADDVTDPDFEDVPGLIYEYSWRRDDTVFTTRTSGLRTDTLEAGTTAKGETWACAVRVLDAYGAATPFGQSAAVMIGNAGPRLTQVNADPATVTGNTVDMAAIAEDDGGEENLTYEWATVSAPAGAEAPQFGANGTNAAKNTRATVFKAGTYRFQVTARDAEGLTAAETVEVTAASVVAIATIAPASIEASVHDVATLMIDSATDQFGDPLAVAGLAGQWQSSGDEGNTWVNLPTPPARAYSRLIASTDNGRLFRCEIGGLPTSIATLTVKIDDTTPPVITLQGSNPATIFQGRTYTDAGATAVDIVDGPVPVEVSGTVSTAVPGICIVSYRATDAAGNQATAEREVHVVRPSPVICGISPPRPLDYDQAQTVTVHGNFFSPECAAWLSNPGLGIPATECPTAFLSGSRLTFGKSFAGGAGNWQLTVRPGDGRESSPFTFHVGAVPQPVLMVRPDVSLNLGVCEVGKTVQREIIVTNVGNAPLTAAAQCNAPFVIIEGQSYSLHPGQSQRLLVGYVPDSPGRHDGILSFGAPQSKTISLTGTAYAPRPTHGVLWGAVRDGDTGEPAGRIAGVLQGVGAVTVASGPDTGLYSLRVSGGMGYMLQAWDTANPPRYEPYRQFIHTLPAGVSLRQDISLTAKQAGGGVALRDIPLVLVRGSGRNLPWTSVEDPSGIDPLLSEKAYWESLRQALLASALSEVWDCNEGLSADRGTEGVSGENSFESGSVRLERFLGAKLAEFKAARGVYPPYLHLVGHGMGGLIIRDWLRTQAYAARQTLTVMVPTAARDGASEAVQIQVGKVFMLGVPNGGTPVVGPSHCLPEWASTRSLSRQHLHFEFNPLAPWPRSIELFMLAATGGATSDSGYLRSGHYAIQNYVRGMTNGRVANSPSDGLTSRWSSQGTEFQGRYVTHSYRTGSWWTGYRYRYYTVYEVTRRDSFVCDYLADPVRNQTDAQLLGRTLDHRQLVTDGDVHAWLSDNLLRPVSTEIPATRETLPEESLDGDMMQTVADQRGVIQPGQTVFCSFVSDADSTLTVDLWLPASGTLSLARPDGTAVLPADAGVDYQESTSEDDAVKHVRYTIGAPAHGNWLTTLQGAEADAASYTVAAAVDSAIVAFPQNGMFFRQFDPAVLLCGLADLSGTAPAVPDGTTGTATVTFPDGSSQTIELFDDGLHGDHAAADGIFGAILPEMPEIGIYSVQYRLTGHHADGLTPFQRVARSEFAVKPGTGLMAGVDSHELADLDGDGRADIVRLNCRMLAAEPATFTLRGTLTDKTGTVKVQAGSPTVLLPEGDNEMTLVFGLDSFAEAGIEGQLSLENLQLFAVIDGASSWTDTYNGSYAVTLGPVLEEQPLGQTLAAGQPANFAVSATGTGPLSYQWRKDGVDLADDGHFAGTQTAMLAIDNPQTGDAGVYTVVVADVNWSTTSQSATLGAATPALSANLLVMPPVPGGNMLVGTVIFGAPVTGFTQDEISLTGATMVDFAAHDDVSFYFEASVDPGVPAVVLHVPAAVAFNAVGTPNLASNAIAVIFLDAGWNVMSPPLQPTAATPAELFAREDGSGIMYQGSVWQWQSTDTGDGSLATANALEALRGYWICMRFPTALVVDGTLYESDTINLAKGWNLFGPAANMSVPLHSSAAGPCWSYGGGGYQAAYTLHPGAGYWIFMWTPAEVDTQISP